MSTKYLVLLGVALVCAAVAAGCGGGKKFPDALTIGPNDIYPIFANSELVVGQNRFAVGVIGKDGSPIVDGKVHLAFYNLNGGKEEKRFEVDAISRVPARDAGIPQQEEHVHADGTVHTHFNAGDEIGIYTAMVNFNEPGMWGVEIHISKGDTDKTMRPKFNVIPAANASAPVVGAPAPPSKNLTAADVPDISQIDSSSSPSPEMHTETIAQAIAAGHPTLVLFAVPGYCTSRLCGPEIEIMRKLYPQWKDRVDFIHVEFYKNPGKPNQEPVDAVKEWGLQSEPWFFVIDKSGRIAARFEGPTSMEELVEAMQQVTSS